jgi:hypothetical protein
LDRGARYARAAVMPSSRVIAQIAGIASIAPRRMP